VPGADLDSQEVYLGLTGNCLGNPSVKWIRDFGTGKGDYFELSASHQIDINPKLALKGTATLSADKHYYRENSGLRAVNLSLEAPVKLNKTGSLVLSPKVLYQKPLNKDFTEEIILGGGLEARF
jgi:hydroxymethylpyrimidine pyrophosphatase-like HAD family hydrolase